MKTYSMIMSLLLLIAPFALADSGFEVFPTAANPAVVSDMVIPKAKVDTWLTVYFTYKKKVDGKWTEHYTSSHYTINLDAHDGVIPGVAVSIDQKTGRGGISGNSSRMTFVAIDLMKNPRSWQRAKEWNSNEYVVLVNSKSGTVKDATEYLSFIFVDEIQKEKTPNKEPEATR